MKLFAVVLNWNGGDDTLAAIGSLGDVPVVCVDNGSTDGSPDVIAARFPHVDLIRTGVNLGFAGGNNVGIRRALAGGADWVLLLNNDATAEPGLAAALESAARARPDAGLLACTILDRDGRTVQYAGATFRPRLGYSGRLETTERDGLRDVGRADGAALAVSSAAIERVGLLDESLFLYVEDVDWSLRIRDAGLAVLLVPDARVRHAGSAASGGYGSTTNLYYDTRNTIAVCERRAPLPHGARGLRRAIVVSAHLAQAARHPRRLAAARAVVDGWRDARAGRLGQRSSA